jgi:uroporphyrinogen decarboxylase
MEMTHWERIEAAIQGDPVDRPPICLWRHWPIEDELPETLADAMIRWQREYDWDLVKHAPTGNYVIYDWGGRTIYVPENSRGLGVSTVTQWAVNSAHDWPELAQLDVTQGHLGRQLEAVRLVAEALDRSVPILQTVFSPLNIAPKLAGELANVSLREHAEIYKRGLQIIAETMARFACESIRAGADGIIFSAPHNQGLYSEEQYAEFGEPYERLILEAVRPEAQIIIGLASGPGTNLRRMSSYPVDGINWHDRMAGPTLKEAWELFPGLLMGGIHERQTLLQGPEETIREEIRDAIYQTGGRRLLVASGSAPYIDTPPPHFRAARDFIEGRRGKLRKQQDESLG